MQPPSRLFRRALSFLALISLSPIALAACLDVPDSARFPVRPPSPVHLPAGLETCNLLGASDGGSLCSIYDTNRFAFSPDGDGTPEDALARRAFLFERWLDLYNAPEKEVVVRTMSRAMAPGDPESVFGDDQYLALNDDHGDSAGFGGRGQMAALFRYAVTGSDADQARMEDWVRGSVMQWDATGIDGYLARFHYAGVPAGTPLKNGYAMNVRDPNDSNSFDIPAAALSNMPAYYQPGIGIDINGTTVQVQPSWEGHTSIDAYAGPMDAWPLVYDHILDPSLRARMARHYGCFLKRLHIFKIINLSRNAALQASIRQYLSVGVLNQGPDEPDLTKLDQIWGFYVPQYNNVSAATFDTTCPAHMSFDAAPEDTIDVSQPDFEGQLLLFFLRQNPDTDQSDSIDFAYYPSARSGDAAMLLSYAEGAYHLTGDAEFLQWRDQVLIGGTNAVGITRTTGALILPKACRSYFRDPNVYTAWLMRTLLMGADPVDRAEAIYDWENKFAAKEEAGIRDTLFAIYSNGATGDLSSALPDATSELLSFGGTVDTLDSPRRNYSTDLTLNPPPGITISTPPAADIMLCDTPITILNITIPTDPADPTILYTSAAPPVMARPPDNWIWEKDPFRAQRFNGDSGQEQYPGLDLSEPYWAARYFGVLPDSHLILAWDANPATPDRGHK